MNITSRGIPVLCAILFTACAPNTLYHEATSALKSASKTSLPAEQRAGLYLDAARQSAKLLDSKGEAGEDANKTYNQSVADLVVLLRTANQGRLWNQNMSVTSPGGTTYHLRFAKSTRDGVWDPAYFTGITRAEDVPDGDLDRRNLQPGTGGMLVGNHRPAKLPPHTRPCGIYAPVTATVEFTGNDATVSLLDPTQRKSARIAGRERTLAADFSAPLASYPQGSELWNGIAATLNVEKHMNVTGLFMVRPYDPKRIPVVFVHGLASTPRMWRRVINELETDPEFRSRYQCWLFSYPTGNPPAYSALRLREELASMQRSYPNPHPTVLIGHSMGGLLSRMQVTTLTRQSWDEVLGKANSDRFFKNVKPGDLVSRSTIYQANPRVGRVIFICTPQRGSKMAVSTIGELATKLISLPVTITSTLTHTLGDSIAIITGDSKHMPNSVFGLSPQNPAYKALDRAPIQAPHHSIIGDRGKGDSPHSSDGVVEYWSSHLDSAASERIVPGSHSACELPETLAEIRRILHLNLKQ